MNRFSPLAAALAALALTACQDKSATVEAEVDPAVSAAVADVRSAAFDSRGKARDAARGFVQPAAAPPGVAPPPTTLGDKGLMGATLDARPTETIGGETAF